MNFRNNNIIMFSAKLKFRKSVVIGKEGSLYYQVILDRMVRQIPTHFHILPEEWDFNSNRIVIHRSSNRNCYLESVSRSTLSDIRRLENIFHEQCSLNINVSVDNIISEFNRQRSGNSLFVFMEQIVELYKRQGKDRTSETYSATLNSFKKFRGGVDLSLAHIDSDIIEAYESYLRLANLSSNTISFYMKHLRAVYNRAVDKEIVADKRPFRYATTSTEKTVKRALSLKTIKRIKSIDLSDNPVKQFARDMFLFSFYTRGMAFVDIAYLKKKDLSGEILTYRRKKTNQRLIIHWEKYMQDILRIYGAEESSPFLFSIIKDYTDDHRRQYLNSMCLINRYLKEIGMELGLALPLTLYCARHSWASIARDEGIPVSVISEGMGHDSEKTTQIYLASLETELVDKANRKILKLL